MTDSLETLGCIWRKQEHTPENHIACPPQHDNTNSSCAHNTDPHAPCVCDLDDYQGWILRWYKHPEKLMYRPDPENRDVQIEGFRWSDYTHAYDIYAPSLQGPFVVEACTGDDLGEGLPTLEDAKALCQRDYAGIMITFHGSRAEYLKERRTKKRLHDPFSKR